MSGGKPRAGVGLDERIRVLVAEDDPADARLLRLALPPDRFDVAVAGDRPAFLEALSQRAPDVIVMDRGLPGDDGLALLRYLRLDPQAREIPVILVTGFGDASQIVEGLDAGANDYVTKPFDASVVRARLELQLRARAVVHELRGLDRVKDEVVGMACHDIQSPVATMVSYADLLLARGAELGPDRTADSLARISRSGKYALQLARDMVDVVVLESGRAELRPEVLSPAEVIEEVAGRHEPRAHDKGITLVAEDSARLPALVADRARLVQVLDNLVSNAVKFCRRGDRISVRALTTDGTVDFQVADSGPGIPDHEIPLLFRKFGRTSVRPSHGERSTGLGLYIAARLVHLHGGTLGVESAVGRGTTFSAVVPRQFARKP